MNQTVLSIIEIILAVVGTVVVLLQNRGEGSDSFFGGGESFKLKRGVDKMLFIATIVILVVFLGLIYVDLKLI